MPFLLIVAMSILAAISYGVLHDQVTARISMEYFSVGHQTIPGLDYGSPTMVALVWGTIATWWVGLGLGLLLGLAARAGSRPKIGVRALLRPIAILLAVMAGGSVLGGLIAHGLASSGQIWLLPHLAERVTDDVAFLTAGGAHLAAYIVGGSGGLVIAVLTWRKRSHLAAPHPRLAHGSRPVNPQA